MSVKNRTYTAIADLWRSASAVTLTATVTFRKSVGNPLQVPCSGMACAGTGDADEIAVADNAARRIEIEPPGAG
jgi:hypothetical protein